MQRDEALAIDIPEKTQNPRETEIRGSGGLKIALSVRQVESDGADGSLPMNTRCASVFLVNRRVPKPDEVRDEAFAFQTQLEVQCDEGFIARPNLRSLESDDWDERVGDLQYRDACENAVGHNISTEAVLTDTQCHTVRTCWIPESEVERVAAAELKDVELSMDALALLGDGNAAQAALGSFVAQYTAWIAQQRKTAPKSPPRRNGERTSEPSSGRREAHRGRHRLVERSSMSRCLPHRE